MRRSVLAAIALVISTSCVSSSDPAAGDALDGTSPDDAALPPAAGPSEDTSTTHDAAGATPDARPRDAELDTNRNDRHDDEGLDAAVAIDAPLLDTLDATVVMDVPDDVVAVAADTLPPPPPPPPLLAPPTTLAPPPKGSLYHGVYPGDLTASGLEDTLSPASLDAYLAGAKRGSVAWVYFSNEWSLEAERFPMATATWIRARGAVPFIRLMMRSDLAHRSWDTKYTMDAIVAGDFDAALGAWAEDAKTFGTPILVEYGGEVNGSWMAWNGSNVDPADPAAGVEKFKAAYRHIVHTMRDGHGLRTASFVFHVDSAGRPDEPWNAIANHYPGDDVIDFTAFSAYGALWEGAPCPDLAPQALAATNALTAAAPTKPIFAVEIGVAADAGTCDAGLWATAALSALLADPRVAGFSWWNEAWTGAHGYVDMQVQDDPGLRAAFGAALSSPRIVETPIFR